MLQALLDSLSWMLLLAGDAGENDVFIVHSDEDL